MILIDHGEVIIWQGRYTIPLPAHVKGAPTKYTIRTCQRACNVMAYWVYEGQPVYSNLAPEGKQ